MKRTTFLELVPGIKILPNPRASSVYRKCKCMEIVGTLFGRSCEMKKSDNENCRIYVGFFNTLFAMFMFSRD